MYLTTARLLAYHKRTGTTNYIFVALIMNSYIVICYGDTARFLKVMRFVTPLTELSFKITSHKKVIRVERREDYQTEVDLVHDLWRKTLPKG